MKQERQDWKQQKTQERHWGSKQPRTYTQARHKSAVVNDYDHFGHWSSTDFDNTMIYSAFGPTYERVMKYLCYYFTCRTGLVWIQASSVL